MLVCVLVDVLGFGLVVPVLPALVGTFTQARDAQAYWYGAMTIVYGLPRFVCAPLIGVPLLAAVEDLRPGDWRVGAPFFASAILQTCSLVVALFLYRRPHRPPFVASGRVDFN